MSSYFLFESINAERTIQRASFTVACVFVLQVPFREAHGLSGKAVSAAESKNLALNQLTEEDLRSIR